MVTKAEKRDNFVRLAEGRTQAALDSIRKLGNLANVRAYEYKSDDIRKIIKALRDATNEIEKKFDSSSGARESTFKL